MSVRMPSNFDNGWSITPDFNDVRAIFKAMRSMQQFSRRLMASMSRNLALVEQFAGLIVDNAADDLHI